MGCAWRYTGQWTSEYVVCDRQAPHGASPWSSRCRNDLPSLQMANSHSDCRYAGIKCRRENKEKKESETGITRWVKSLLKYKASTVVWHPPRGVSPVEGRSHRHTLRPSTVQYHWSTQLRGISKTKGRRLGGAGSGTMAFSICRARITERQASSA